MHLTNTKVNSIKLLALGIVLTIFSVIFFLVAYGEPAARSELIELHGKVSNIKEIRGKYGVSGFDFKIGAESQFFRFKAHGIEREKVLTVLKSLDNEKIRILAHPNGELSWFSGLRKLPVYAITIPSGPEISYEQLSRAWTETNTLLHKISGASAVVGLIFIFLSLYFHAKPN
ncbi:hypothetical protein ACX0MV_14355 [Pseudomonas borbori]